MIMRNATKSLVLVLLLISVSVVTGCSTLADVVGKKEDGTSQVYSVNADQAWEIAKVVFRTEGTDAIEEHRAEGYMLTSSGMNMVSWGAVMGAWIDPVGKDETMVTVLTKRRITVNIATTLMESTFHRRFAQGVQIVKSGNQLPALLPSQ
jgi:hypothetical protein